jgi:hypothetical protein
MNYDVPDVHSTQVVSHVDDESVTIAADVQEPAPLLSSLTDRF